MKHPQNLGDILVADIAELHSAEVQISLALPTMKQLVSASDFKVLVEEYFYCTEENARHLERAKKILVSHPCPRFCDCMTLLIAECEDKYSTPNQAIRDACLAAGLQKINYLKLALYESAHELSRLLGLAEVHGALAGLLAREMGFKKKLYVFALGNNRPAGLIYCETVSLNQ